MTTPSDSDFLAAARAKCEEYRKKWGNCSWVLGSHEALARDIAQMLPRALSLIDSQTALLAARDAEIAGLKAQGAVADTTLAEIKERMRALTMLVPDGFARDCLDALAYAERIAQERDEWRSRAQDAENAAAATRQECDGMLARWGTAIQALGEHASPGLDLGECVFAVVARLSAASDRIAALTARAEAAESVVARLREWMEGEHERWGENVGALDEPAEYGARRTLESALAKLASLHRDAAPAKEG